MWQYAALGGGLLLIGLIVYIVIKMMVRKAEKSAKQGEIIKQLDVSNAVLVAERDAAINGKVDRTDPNAILGRM